jgi:sucrose-6-phosphate hydrolase SacC (GH32 family)
VQTPVRELQNLRYDRVELNEITVNNTTLPLGDRGISGAQLEIEVTFEVGDATDLGLMVRTGEEEQTIVGYNVTAQELYVDRNQSGDSRFHPRFAGRHAGPMAADHPQIQLHLFVDAASVEVFGGDGEIVLTECIFPNPQSTGVALFAQGGTAKVLKLQAWRLKSAW